MPSLSNPGSVSTASLTCVLLQGLLTGVYIFYNIVYMKNIQNLGEFEQVVLLAILRLKDVGAYGVSIRNEISERTARSPTPGAIYTTLERLEDKGLLKSSVGEATPERGGRAKRYYHLTGRGQSALRRAHSDYRNLLQGLDFFGESYA